MSYFIEFSEIELRKLASVLMFAEEMSIDAMVWDEDEGCDGAEAWLREHGRLDGIRELREKIRVINGGDYWDWEPVDEKLLPEHMRCLKDFDDVEN